MANLPKLDCNVHWNSNSDQINMKLKRLKEQLYRQNSTYLCKHPELRAIIRVLLHELINKQPENIYEFAAAFFNCNNSPLLVTKINQQLKMVNKNLKQSRWNQYDAETFFTEIASTHSLLSETSLANDIDNMLRYAMLTSYRKVRPF